MSTLDDKLLGIQAHNYCSEDEGEHEEDRESRSGGSPPSGIRQQEDDASSLRQEPVPSSVAVNTGPKGVMEDRRLYMEMRKKKESEDRKRVIADMKKLSLNNPPANDILDEDFFKDYCAKRLEELRHKFDRLPTFGVVSDLTADNFNVAIDNEHPDTILLIHIYVDEKSSACQALNACFNILAKKYLKVKFCTFKPPSGAISETFRQKGCPAIVGYRGGKVCANLVCLERILGDDFYVIDVESLLLNNKMLPKRFHERVSAESDEDDRADDDNQKY